MKERLLRLLLKMELNPLKNRLAVVLLLATFSVLILLITRPSDVPKEPEDGLLPSCGPLSGQPTPSGPDPSQPSPSPQEEPEKPLYRYEKKTADTPDGPLNLHVLSIDLSNPDITVKPVTAHRTLFGYKYLSEMASEHGAVAAVNGGFSHSNGLPGGMIHTNKELKTAATGKFPVLFISEDKAYLSDVTQDIWLESEGNQLSPLFYNTYSTYGGLFVFTPVYGSTDRIEKPHLTARVINGTITDITNTGTMAKIPSDGFLVSAVGDYPVKRLKDFAQTGRSMAIQTRLSIQNPHVADWLSAYECGSWLLREGKDVSPAEDAWAGNLTGRAPRTVVGIRDDGALVFVVADGRQAESVGAGAPELARILSEMGIRDAALLDGGASSEMIIEGRIVNAPSAGRERMLFSSFLVLKK